MIELSILASLRKTWLVIYGENAPKGEIAHASLIAEHLRTQFNIARAVPSSALALDLLIRTANVVVLGGPIGNEWAVKLNEYVNPRWHIVVNRVRSPGETWKQYVESGGIDIPEYTLNGSPYTGEVGTGIIGIGSQPYIRARPLITVFVGGWTFEDTCTVGKAFRELAPLGIGEVVSLESIAGVYRCTNTPVPEMDNCPTSMTYTLLAAGIEPI